MSLTISYELYEGDDGESIMVEFPAHYEVCPRCRGAGKHVNPSIDGHGIGREEFDADPEFEEAYFSGVYDVVCYDCKGERVVLVENDYETFTVEQKTLYDRLEVQWEDDRAYRRLVEMERRMLA